MKRILLVSLLTLTSFVFAFGQKKPNKVETDKIHVSGVCNECKERIENAAYLPGVKRAEWNKDSKMLTVSYKTDKVSLVQIEKSIAKAGHDAGDVKATDSAYGQLPSCCAYHEKETH